MKVAILGNMNNSGFALMRYFRDIGVDAHLLLYANDGQGISSHFKPECDTWEYEKWKPYIHQTIIANAITPALSFPLSWITYIQSFLRNLFTKELHFVKPISRKKIRRLLFDYDYIIGSGNVPAICFKAGIKLDIFYPYSIGVEFLDQPALVRQIKKSNLLKIYIINKMRILQTQGIADSRFVLNAEVGPTEFALTRRGVKPIRLTFPMIFVEDELAPSVPSNDKLRQVSEIILYSKFTILHHARLMWKNPVDVSEQEWRKESKNNDWLLYAFSRLVKDRSNLNPILFIVEYGTDVDVTRSLINELEVEKNVYWIPKMMRRDLMWILSRVSIGVGEFYDIPRIIWGGTGWEVLASGKPLLQGFNFEKDEFQQIFNYPQPPMLPVHNNEDVVAHLIDMADNPEKREQIGRDAKEWFNRYNGIGLAKQWLDLLMTPQGREERIRPSSGKKSTDG